MKKNLKTIKKLGNWKYIIGFMIVVALVLIIINQLPYKKAFKMAKDSKPKMAENIEKLSQDEHKHLELLWEQSKKIYSKYLTAEEYSDYIALTIKGNEGDVSEREIRRVVNYYQKVIQKCSKKELKIITEFTDLSWKLAGNK